MASALYLFVIGFGLLHICGKWLVEPNPSKVSQCLAILIAPIGAYILFLSFLIFIVLTHGTLVIAWWMDACVVLWFCYLAFGAFAQMANHWRKTSSYDWQQLRAGFRNFGAYLAAAVATLGSMFI